MNGILQRHDEDSNQPIQKHIGVHTKPLNGVSIRKNVSCGSFYSTQAEKCTTLMNERSAFPLFIFSHLEVILIFIQNAHCTSRKNQAYVGLKHTHNKALSSLLL